jgi:hypothetical protein
MKSSSNYLVACDPHPSSSKTNKDYKDEEAHRTMALEKACHKEYREEGRTTASQTSGGRGDCNLKAAHNRKCQCHGEFKIDEMERNGTIEEAGL